MKIFIIATLCAVAIAAPKPMYGQPDTVQIVYEPPVYLQPQPQPVIQTQPTYPQPQPSYPQTKPKPVIQIQPSYPQPQTSYPQPQPSYPQPQPSYPQPQPSYPQPQPSYPQPQPTYPTKAVYPLEPSKPVEKTVDYPAQPYSFEWEVEDKASANDFEHSESSDGKVVSGSYKVNLPDGRRQIVTYRDDGNGYVADVKYEGEAFYPENTKPSYPAQVVNPPAPVYPRPPVPQLPYGTSY